MAPIDVLCEIFFHVPFHTESSTASTILRYYYGLQVNYEVHKTKNQRLYIVNFGCSHTLYRTPLPEAEITFNFYRISFVVFFHNNKTVSTKQSTEKNKRKSGRDVEMSQQAYFASPVSTTPQPSPLDSLASCTCASPHTCSRYLATPATCQWRGRKE